MPQLAAGKVEDPEAAVEADTEAETLGDRSSYGMRSLQATSPMRLNPEAHVFVPSAQKEPAMPVPPGLEGHTAYDIVGLLTGCLPPASTGGVLAPHRHYLGVQEVVEPPLDEA